MAHTPEEETAAYFLDQFRFHCERLEVLTAGVTSEQYLGILFQLKDKGNTIAKDLWLAQKYSLNLIDQAERLARGEVVQG